MKWHVTNYFCKILFDESGARRGRIRHTSKGYLAFDLRGRLMVSVCQADQSLRYVITVAGKTLSARLIPGDARKVPWFRMPRADRMELEWDGAPVQLKQLENRDFSMAQGPITGDVKGLPGRKAMIDTNVSGVEWASLLYILAHIMLHEDDVDIV